MILSNKVARAFAAHYITTCQGTCYLVEVFENVVRLWKDDTCLAKAYCYDGAPISVVQAYPARTPEGRCEQELATRILQEAAHGYQVA